MNHAAHFVQFFEADDRLVRGVSRFLGEGLESSCTCVAVATPEHRAAIADALAARGLDPAALEADYRYIALDASETLAKISVDGAPDGQRFHEVMGLLIRQVAARGQPVRIFGEMVALLAKAGRLDAVIRLEELWNELSRHHSFTLFCTYPLTAFAGDLRSQTLVCAIHGHVVPTE
jgi:hypothetical protein